MTTSESQGPLTSSVEKLRQELDKWLDVAWNQGEKAMDAIGLKPGRRHSLRADILEDEECVTVIVSVPGVAAEDIDLKLIGNMLTITGAFPSIDLGAKGVLHVQERPVGEFCRSIPLPAGVDATQVSADCQQGVLKVRIAKSPSARPIRIPVTTSHTPPPPTTYNSPAPASPSQGPARQDGKGSEVSG
ncbi:MAG: Hsp20/alpha crystallin family protein [Planctomycetaceae bacterium]